MQTLKVLICCAAIGSMGLAASAQPPAGQPPAGGRPGAGGGGGGGQPRPAALAPEKAKAAWELEATGVAKRLGLSDDQAKAVVKAYAEARESHNAAAEKLRKEAADKRAKDAGNDGSDGNTPGGGRGAEQRKAMEDMNAAERAKLHRALSGTLSADQTTKAVASLGTFNPIWDRMVDVLAGLHLEGAKQQDSLNAVEDFIVAQTKAIQSGAGGDREAAQAARQEARQKLVDSLKKTLSEEQINKIEEALRAGGGRGGRPGGGAGGGDGGGGGDGNTPPRRPRGGG